METELKTKERRAIFIIRIFFFFLCTHYFHSAIFRDGLLLICLFHSSFIYFLTFAFCRHAKSMVQYYWRRSPDTIIHRCLSRFIVSGPKYLPTVTGKKCQFYKKDQIENINHIFLLSKYNL